MTLYAFDTDCLTLLRRNHPVIAARVRALAGQGLVTTVITVEEQLTGWYTSARKAKSPTDLERAYRRLAETVTFFNGVRVLPFPLPAIAMYQRLVAAKLNVKKNDLRIAAIALEAGAVVVTRNAVDFGRVPGLAFEDWSLPSP